MGKRSNYARLPKDLYLTIDPKAAASLIPFLRSERITSFVEPCYGWGHLVGPLTAAGLECVGRYDVDVRGREIVDPHAPGDQGRVMCRDGRDLCFADLRGADAIITNPPWSRALLHTLIARWASMVPTWLLFDAGWKHTGQAARLMRLCTDFVPVPRLRWMPGTAMAATDDCGWYRFHAAEAALGLGTRFWPLGATPADSGALGSASAPHSSSPIQSC
ncbi:hypothetical protein [Roseibium sediminis]|uniref:hypothetical protein n=1 Tax=Roseibium sediminis TaxID=1775174 RepID=UPI0018655333|nr:hypothetical protein [Roseibium sediminis]